MATVDEMLAQVWAQHQQGNVVGAEAAYRTLIEKVPGYAHSHVYLGIALFDLRRYCEAVDEYRKALQLTPHFPIAWNNLGNALRMVGEIEAADAAFENALTQKPDYLNAMKNRGTLWVWAGELERGLRWYERALAVNPEDAEVHRNLGIIYLAQGRYEEGWREYRYRWSMPGLVRPAISKPIWQGESLTGKSIFVYPEQGLGDAIQFARMIPKLRDLGARVAFGCEPKLIPLFSGLKGVGEIVPVGATLGTFDYQASLVEVVDRTWEGFAGVDGSAYLSIPDNLLQYWSGRLRDLRGVRIGLCWQGNRDFHADVYRSFPLAALQSLFQLENVSLVSLQFGFGSEQIGQVPFGDSLVRLPADIDRSGGAFMDTAAVISNLDLVISCDTSTGHLAGALGVPTWLLLAKVPDWRWGLTGQSTPWYNSHRLWRQQEAGDWLGVGESISREISAGVVVSRRK